MEKQHKKHGKKWIWIVAAVVVMIGAGGFVLLKAQANATSTATTYKTETLATGNITNTVGATGNVYARQSVQLTWKTSGIVQSVDVTKGQQVTSGTVLAQLQQSSLPQDVINAAIDLTNAKNALNNLLNSNTARATAELTLVQAEQTLVSAQKTAQSKTFQRASQQTIDIAQANLIQAQAALDNATTIYNQNKARATNDVQYAAALSQFAQAQQKFNSAELNYSYVQSLPDPLTVQAANAEVDLAQAKYLDAKRAWELVKDGPPATDVAAAQAKVAAAQAILDEAKITAPISGTVVAIDTQPGDLVSPQTAAIKIDDLSHLYVDISVSEVDINQVKLGQPVQITFDAISSKTYNGKVTDISMEGSSSSGTVNFTVTAEITDADAQIMPGMTASANIVVTELNNALLVPSSAIRTINGSQIVYIMQNNVLTPVPITTGITDSSGTSIEVTSNNLKAGDLIVLNPPSATTSSTTTGRGFFGLFGLGGGARDGGPSGDFQPPSGSRTNQGSSSNNTSPSGNSGNVQTQ